MTKKKLLKTKIGKKTEWVIALKTEQTWLINSATMGQNVKEKEKQDQDGIENCVKEGGAG